VFVSNFMLYVTALCKLGFASLMGGYVFNFLQCELFCSELFLMLTKHTALML